MVFAADKSIDVVLLREKNDVPWLISRADKAQRAMHFCGAQNIPLKHVPMGPPLTELCIKSLLQCQES